MSATQDNQHLALRIFLSFEAKSFPISCIIANKDGHTFSQRSRKMASVLVKAARAQDSTGTQAAALAEGNCSSLGMQPPTRPSCPKVTDAMESRTILPRSARAPEVAGETLNLAHRQSASAHSPP